MEEEVEFLLFHIAYLTIVCLYPVMLLPTMIWHICHPVCLLPSIAHLHIQVVAAPSWLAYHSSHCVFRVDGGNEDCNGFRLIVPCWPFL